MRRSGVLAALVLAPAWGCVTYPAGELAAVSTEELPLRYEVVAEEVEGRACDIGFQERFKRAVDAALARAPGATALVDVTYSFERFCAVARGRAVVLR